MKKNKEFEKEIEKCLLDFSNIKSKNINKEKFKLLCNRIYELIKEEIIEYGDSELYYKIDSMDFDKTFLNDLVKKELLELNDKGIKSNPIIMNIKDNNYFKIIIIKLILKEKGLYNHLDIINERFNDAKNNSYKFDLIDSELDSTQKELSETRKVLDSCKDKFKNKLISLITLISIILGGGVATNSFAKKYSEGNLYLKDCKYFPNIGPNRECIEEYYDNTKGPRKIMESYIRFCGPWIKSGNKVFRNVLEYNISKLNLSRSKYYNRKYFESIGLEPQKIIDKKPLNKIYKSDLYSGETIEFLDVYYKYKGKTIIDKNYNAITIAGYILILLLIITHIEGDVLIETEITGVYDSLLFKVLKEYMEAKKNNNNLSLDFQKNIKSLIEYIQSNEYLNNELKQLYEENKYLLDDRDELDSRLEEEVEKMKNKILHQKQLLKKYESNMI